MARNLPDHPSVKDPRSTLAAAVTLAVAGATFAGSAAALAAIGKRAGMTGLHGLEPWVLPIGLDGLAIVAVAAIGRRRNDLLAWAAPITAAAVSTTLQVDVLPLDLAHQVARGVPPIAALLAFELFLHASEPTVNVRDTRAADRKGTTPNVKGGERKKAQPKPGLPRAHAPQATPIVPEGYDSAGPAETGIPVSQIPVSGTAGRASGADPERATLADARRIDAARHLSGRELERAILAAGLKVTRRRATAWAKELAAPDAPDAPPAHAPPAPPAGAPRHLEAVAR